MSSPTDLTGPGPCRYCRGRRVVEGMEGSLRPGLDVDRAAALLRALCRAEVYRELVEESGWSPDEYEAWLRETLKGQLLSRRSGTARNPPS